MLRTEIEDFISQLFNSEKELRQAAKVRLMELEKDGEITIEILQPHLNGDNLVTKKYAIESLRRIDYAEKQNVLNDIFLKNDDLIIFAEFIDNFLKLQNYSFEEIIMKKIAMLNPLIKKEKDQVLKAKLLQKQEQFTLLALPYFQECGTSICHDFLYDLLKSKNNNIRYNSFLALMKSGAKFTNSFLKEMSEKKGLTSQLAKMLLEKK